MPAPYSVTSYCKALTWLKVLASGVLHANKKIKDGWEMKGTPAGGWGVMSWGETKDMFPFIFTVIFDVNRRLNEKQPQGRQWSQQQQQSDLTPMVWVWIQQRLSSHIHSLKISDMTVCGAELGAERQTVSSWRGNNSILIKPVRSFRNI